MDERLRPMRPRDITPPMVLDSIRQDSENWREMYIVSLTKNGTCEVYVSGDLSGIAHCALCLTDMASAFVRGEINTERFPDQTPPPVPRNSPRGS